MKADSCTSSALVLSVEVHSRQDAKNAARIKTHSSCPRCNRLESTTYIIKCCLLDEQNPEKMKKSLSQWFELNNKNLE